MSTVAAAPGPVRQFLEKHGFETDAPARLLGGGGRHQVYEVGRRGAKRAALKVYEAAASGRDAFARESAFHDLLARHLPASIPAVLARDAPSRAVLFEWIEGRRPAPADWDTVTPRRLAAFVCAVNASAVRADARHASLPRASDAAFAWPEHVRTARGRIDALLAVQTPGPLGDALHDFLRSELQPALASLRGDGRSGRELPETEWTLSPSDFGFHNVIERASGALCFIDFEHAGWDDPAKMAADFILQPEAPLTPVLAESFLAELDRSGRFPGDLRERVAGLLPVQAIKWTTIVLNVFQRPGAGESLLGERLAKARGYWAATGFATASASADTPQGGGAPHD